jgi:hypothetical protein
MFSSLKNSRSEQSPYSPDTVHCDIILSHNLKCFIGQISVDVKTIKYNETWGVLKLSETLLVRNSGTSMYVLKNPTLNDTNLPFT